MGREKPVLNEVEINERFRLLRETVEGPRGKLRFARKIGESHSNVSRYETGRTIPGHVLMRAVRVYGASAEWLLQGKGEMFTRTTADEIREMTLAAPKTGPEAPVKPGAMGDVSDFYILPLLRDPTAAGPGRRITDNDVEGPAIIHKAWCPHPNTTDYVRVKGDSMEPCVPDGSIVTIDKSLTDPEALLGHVVAIYIDATEDVTLRRLHRDDVNPRRFIGVPDHPTRENRPHVIEERDRIIGRVLSVHALVQ